MNNLPPIDYDRNDLAHKHIRIFIVLLVVIVALISVIMMENQKDDVVMDFGYAHATVQWDNESRLFISLNKSYIYNISVTGSYDSHIIEIRNTSIIGKNHTLIDIDGLLSYDMTIKIQIESVSLGITETQGLKYR